MLLPTSAISKVVIMQAGKQPPGELRNRILSSLPKKEYNRLLPHMELVSLERGQTLIAPGETIRHAYFPLNAVISIASFTEGGLSIETGVIGSDAILGLPVLLGMNTTPMQSVVQIPGRTMRIQAKAFKSEFNSGGAFTEALLRYMHVLAIEISQTAACNKLHSIEARLARWLLMSSNSIGSDELPLTQDFISSMLGIRRAGVTEAASALRRKGLISCRRGLITIGDPAGLEAEAYGCYGVVKQEYDRLFPPQV
jgi:CRP-like cAMP-binding protein